MAHKLAAARPLVWRGGGDLLQLPWQALRPGLLVVLDLWSGYAGLPMALLALGQRVVALSAEMGEGARSVAEANAPNILHTPRVGQVSSTLLLPLSRRRQVSRFLIGGGRPLPGQHQP